MITVRRFESGDLDDIYAVENQCFSIPWTKESLKQDVCDNKISIYFVALKDERIVGYAGMWHVVTEGHITNVAVLPDFRGLGIGELLVLALVGIAREREMIGLTLEVRMGNRAAMGLYSKHGFKAEGIRKNYYEDTKEDAVVMWKYFENN